MAHLARGIARVVEVGDAMIGLRLKLWIDDVFAFARGLASDAVSNARRKRRRLDDRIADIPRADARCDETQAALGKIANACDQLLTFAEAPGIEQNSI